MHRADKALEQVWDNFFKERSKVLTQRFPGWYRGIVVETNDPLNMHRTRVKIPEFYDHGTKDELVAWAIPAPWMGGRMAGSWTHPMKDDIVYISFEKQHPYGPIWTSAADPSRRRSYSLWSIYTKPASPVNEDGQPSSNAPKDHLKKYLPQDNRPMSTGWNDRYGNFFMMSSVGFFPKSHEPAPAPAGTDGLTKKKFEVSKNPPKNNDPDVKFFSIGSKYGHFIEFGDQGYKWKEEFKGDFDEDSDFEISRVKYFIRHFCEDQPKDHDQRRIDIRTRCGHRMEMRDVGWEKTRQGEYGPTKTIADSKDKDERWLKLRSKGGHLIQALDIGFDPVNDLKYKTLNKTEVGDKEDGESVLGTAKGNDSRMIRIISRHGNQLILDDRGSSPTSANKSETPHGNGVLLRSRKGFQLQFIDKKELNHAMIATPEDQVFEMNDKFQYVMASTKQAGEVHTKDRRPGKTRPRIIKKTGHSHDFEKNTHHWKLDKANDYSRYKTPEGAGMEMRGSKAPCGSWVEIRDQENRAIWFSKADQWLLIRSKKGKKYILLDDNDDVILIRNEEGKIQIRAKDKLEFKCDNGDICFEAPKGQIGMRAKSIEMETGGASHKIWAGGIGTTKTIWGDQLKGFHPDLHYNPLACGPKIGDGKSAPQSGSPCKVKNKKLKRKKPKDFDKERGCDSLKQDKGPVPDSVVNSPPGSGTGSGNRGSPGAPSVAPTPSNNEPGQTVLDPLPVVPEVDPISKVNPDPEGGAGVLWYGVSSKFGNEIDNIGLNRGSLSNHLNIPDKKDAIEIPLSKTIDFARGDKQAVLSQKRYGDVDRILRIRSVPDGDLLRVPDDDDDIVYYRGDISRDENIEIFEIGEDKPITLPLFPDI